MKRWLCGFVIAAVSLAQWQLVDVAAELPLATVGMEPEGVWSPQGDEFEFVLSEDALVRLWIYSPSIDLAAPGNERFLEGPLASEFVLLEPNTRWLRTSGWLPEGPSEWLSLHDGPLPAGRYVLQSLVYGPGKNVFLPLLEVNGVRRELRSVRPTINVRSSDWLPAARFELGPDDDNCALYSYDGDGPELFEARVTLPDGRALPLTVSGNLAWASDPLPAMAGGYLISARIPEGSPQGTNAVRLMVICGEAEVPLELLTEQTLTAPDPILPVEVAVIDPAGAPLPLPVTLEGEIERVATLADSDDYRLLELRLEGGERLDERSVRFGRAGGRVTFVLEPIAALPVPRPDIQLQLAPARPLPVPAPVVALAAEPAPQPARLLLERSLSDSDYLPCEVLTVTLTVRNVGETAGRFILLESLPEGVSVVDANGLLSDASALRWAGELEAGGQRQFSYQLLAAQQSQLNLVGALLSDEDGPGGVLARDEAQLTRRSIEAALTRLAPEGELFAGDTVTLALTVNNPLARPVRLRLPSASAGARLLEAPEALELPAKGTVSVPITLKLEQPGAAIVQVAPTACEAGAALPSGQSVSWREEVLALPELPPQTQRTVVTVELAAFDLPRLEGLVLVQALPEGVRYIAGSALIDGQSAPEPEQVEGSLIFQLSASIATLSFAVLHEVPYLAQAADSSIIALTPEPQLLLGDPEALARYLKAPRQGGAVVQRERVGAVILAPADGALLDSNLATIVVDAPLEDAVTLLVNGEPVAETRIGTVTRDRALMRQTLEYLGVRLEAGPNTIVLESRAADGTLQRDQLTIFARGVPERVHFTPITPLVAGSAQPLRLLVTVTDAWGNAPTDGYITFELEGARPVKPDENPQQLGYQLALRNGRTELWLEPLPEPAELVLTAIIGRPLAREVIFIGSELRPWIVSGYGSVGVNLGRQGLGFGLSGSLFARGQVWNSLLTVAANAPLSALGIYGNPFEQFPIAGASGEYGASVQSRHGVYARLEHQRSYLQYGDFVTELEGELLALNRSYTGLSGQYRPAERGVVLRGYAALAAAGRVRELELAGNDSRVYQLPQRPVRPGSLTLEVIKRDGRDPRRLIRDDGDPLVRVLSETFDYLLDAPVGIIRLSFRLPEADAQGNRYFLRASYELEEDSAARALQFGVQALYLGEGWQLRAGAVRDGEAASATQVVAVGGRLEREGLVGDVELAYGRNREAGGIAALLRVGYRQEALEAEVRYQLVAPGYRSSTADGTSAGHSAAARLAYAFTPSLSASAELNLSHLAATGATQLSGGAFGVYRLSGPLPIGERPTVRFGVQFDSGALRAVLGGSVDDAFGLAGLQLAITHRQGLTAASSSITEFGVAVRLLDNLTLRLIDRLEWGQRNQLLIGLEAAWPHGGAAGRTRLTAQYELEGGVSGRAGRARLGVDTSYPLSDNLTLSGALSQTIGLDDPRDTVTALSAGVRYDTAQLTAEAAYDLRFGISVRQAAFLGVTAALAEALYGSLTLDALSDSDPESGGRGFKVSLAAAYRGDRLTLLANHALRGGVYAPEGALELSGDTRLTVLLEGRWSLRAGHLYRVSDGSWQQLASLGASADLWAGGALGAYGRLLIDGASRTLSPGLTLELSQLFGCGVYGVVGVNLFDGNVRHLGVLYQPGVFVRADVVFDESWRCGAGRISGQVVDGGNAPLSGVVVQLLTDAGQEVAQTMTSSDGSFTFDPVLAGRYRVVIVSPYGYQPAAAMMVTLARAQHLALPPAVLQRE